MGITFAVDAVEPARARLPEKSFRLASLAPGAELLGSSHEELSLVAVGLPEVRVAGGPPEDHVHALAQAVDLAFNEHRPLRLTPDALWITLAQGFGIHVRQNAEALRERFVRHEGRKVLKKDVFERPQGAAWGEVLESFRPLLAQELGAGLCALLTQPFSTTTRDAETVFHLALMDTFSPYFEYEVALVCGIPEVTLEGSPEDWRDLKRRVEVLGEYDLRWWTEQLLPICEQWIATAEGRPDKQFWQALHRPERMYGGSLCTGWLARLFPYLGSGPSDYRRNVLVPARAYVDDGVTKPGSIFEAEYRREKRTEQALAGEGPIVPWAHPGVSLGELPASWSRVDLRWDESGVTPGGEPPRGLQASGGLLGVRQAADGLALDPAVAWVLTTAVPRTWWDMFASRHSLERVPLDGSAVVFPPETPGPGTQRRALSGALGELYQRFRRGLLCDGALELLPREGPADPERTEGYARLLECGCFPLLRVGARGYVAQLVDPSAPAWRAEGLDPAALRGSTEWILYFADAARPLAEARYLSLGAGCFLGDLHADAEQVYFLKPGVNLLLLGELVPARGA